MNARTAAGLAFLLFGFFLATAQATDPDADGDGLSDVAEQDSSPIDTDGDGTPDHLDADDDGDGVLTRLEDLDADGNYAEHDSDGNGVANYLDGDDDGDDVPTALEDVDGSGDWFDDDANGNQVPAFLDAAETVAESDGDGVPDAVDNCPAIANPGQADADGDAIGDACDPRAVSAALVRAVAQVGTLAEGALAELAASDNTYVIHTATANAGQTAWVADLRVTAQSPQPSIERLDVTVETSEATGLIGATAVYLRNWSTGGWTLLERYRQPSADLVRVFENVPTPGDYVHPTTARIVVRLVARQSTTQQPSPPQVAIDHVGVTVTPF
jgi:hypothetical protein